ncbi:hypothetical protein BDA96_02G324800 [Sorghum bicolor]|uniref:Expansin-like EG45 domain-containing protein n=2 Tax=Sorghum bicolor TaxID=4558 RepID=A0A921UUG1_SORBI|nr:hypothetical protein BDA96_02G324800 [Sorghum bicolor]OQU89980.1 hypothetical protein SORBI_3002G309300 [Sorghum bicolor]
MARSLILYVQQYNLLSLVHSSPYLYHIWLFHSIICQLCFISSCFISWATADGNFTVSKAVYYTNSDTRGTEPGACEYGTFEATLNNGDVSASANLYRNGVGCGACYQVIVTESEASDGTDFILSHAFTGMGQNQNAGSTLMNLCHFPYYLEFQTWYQQGNQDIIAIQLCETVNLTCQLLSQTHGAVWAAVSPPTPSGPLSIRMLFSSRAPHGSDQKWLVPTSTIP